MSYRDDLLMRPLLQPSVCRKASKQECPDYESAGPNSCHFDKRHTSVWKMYCMEVTAVTSQGNHTSQQKCVDVQEIGRTTTNTDPRII